MINCKNISWSRTRYLVCKRRILPMEVRLSRVHLICLVAVSEVSSSVRFA